MNENQKILLAISIPFLVCLWFLVMNTMISLISLVMPVILLIELMAMILTTVSMASFMVLTMSLMDNLFQMFFKQEKGNLEKMIEQEVESQVFFKEEKEQLSFNHRNISEKQPSNSPIDDECILSRISSKQ